MHIVFLCQIFYPDTQSTSQLFTDLFGALKDEGLKITVVTGAVRGKDGSKLSGREQIGNLEIRRTGLAFNYRRNLFLRGIHYLAYLSGSALQLWKLRKCDLVFGVTNPPFMPVWLWLLNRLFVRRYQILLSDIFPEGLVALGKLGPGHFVTRLWRWANRHALREAEQVLVLGRDMAELVAKGYHVLDSKIRYVPHWSSFEADSPISVGETRLVRQLGLQGKFLVQYSGNMGLWHDIERIVLAANELRSEPSIHFLMIGGGMRRGGAEELSRKLELPNMTWLPLQLLESLQDSLSCCHLALISQRDGLQGIAVPCKLYGILASGRGILAVVPPPG